MLTGTEVRDIRQRFGWTIEQFARVLGVHPVTLNRWELLKDGSAPIDGTPGAILLGLRRRLTELEDAREVRETAKKVDELLVVGGVLVALAALLAFVNRGK